MAEDLSLNRILNQPKFTRQLHRTVERFRKLPGSTATPIAFDLSTWNSADRQALNGTRRAYAESWALCHLLHYNANYQKKFQILGQQMLAGQADTLTQTLRSAHREIDFELQQFQEHLADGYRVDLCRWPWEAEFVALEQDRSTHMRLMARAGFQATEILVRSGEEYSVKITGSWGLLPDGATLDGTGNAEGWGDVEGVILKDFTLTSPFALSPDSALVPPRAGKLYLRCHDRWNHLGDNHGALRLQLTRIR